MAPTCDRDVLRDVLARWAQETRFASVMGAPGVTAGDARGVVVDAPMSGVVQSLVQVTQ